jgi:hypothetical protein
MSSEPKDWWDKAAIILTPVGGLLTAMAVAWIGYSLNILQANETNVRLYAELMGKREEADTNLRKDMFNSAIKTFVESKPVSVEKEVLDLELLAYNFHESIDLGPIFKDVYTRLLDRSTPLSESDGKTYRERVERLAKEIIDKEISVLEVEGKLDADVFFDELAPQGSTVIEGALPGREGQAGDESTVAPLRNFEVTVLRVNREKREMRIDLKIRTPRDGADRAPKKEAAFVHSTFWVGFSDFPMIDNTRLSEGYRCAVVLREFDELRAKITLIYFPTSRAALKDKPYFDEMMDDLLRARRHLAEHETVRR